VCITIDRHTLRLVMATPDMHLYELRLTEKPELLIDRREIVEACFVHPGVLHEVRDRDKIGVYVRRSEALPSSAASHPCTGFIEAPMRVPMPTPPTNGSGAAAIVETCKEPPAASRH